MWLIQLHLSLLVLLFALVLLTVSTAVVIVLSRPRLRPHSPERTERGGEGSPCYAEPGPPPRRQRGNLDQESKDAATAI